MGADVTVASGRNVTVRPRVHARLTALKDAKEAEFDRVVSFSEVVEMLLDTWAEVTP
jgi:cyclopropane fatty-acyl-phospholipid synthase-like methyltransferase